MYHKIGFAYKEQTAMEYLWAYVWTFILLIIITAAIAINALSRAQIQTPTTFSCIITGELNCENLLIMTNSTSAKGVVVFTNGLGTVMHFPANGFNFFPYQFTTNAVYTGGCVPTNVQSGSTVICNATITNFRGKLAEQFNPRFIFSYQVCQNRVCDPAVYNTTGSGTAYVSEFSGAYTKIK